MEFLFGHCYVELLLPIGKKAIKLIFPHVGFHIQNRKLTADLEKLGQNS